MHWRFLLVLGFAAGVTGCAPLGPRTIAPNQFDYNQAINDSWNEQLLLNVVRLRYQDTPMFLEVSSVVSGYSVSVDGRLAHRFGFGLANQETNGSTGFGVSERPTISYRPLQGEAFTERFLTPLTPDTIVLLADSGWSLKVILLACVQELNELRNAPAVPGAPFVHSPEFNAFRSVVELFDAYDRAGLLDIRLEVAEEGGTPQFSLTFNGEAMNGLSEALEEMGLDRKKRIFSISHHRIAHGEDTLALTGRSLMGVLQFLSQGVVAPAADIEAGRVAQVLDEEGNVCPTGVWMDDFFKIHTSGSRPEEAFVATRFRGSWFYIKDTDLQTKATFGLLNQLFSLQASSHGGLSPLLTIPAQ